MEYATYSMGELIQGINIKVLSLKHTLYLFFSVARKLGLMKYQDKPYHMKNLIIIIKSGILPTRL